MREIIKLTRTLSRMVSIRLRDDRTKDNGWKLTAQLSDFSDETNSTVLTNSGIALKWKI